MTVEVHQSGSQFGLFVRTVFGLSAAGPRLERGTPLPITQFKFDSDKDAMKARGRLQEYINKNHTTKKKK